MTGRMRRGKMPSLYQLTAQPDPREEPADDFDDDFDDEPEDDLEDGPADAQALAVPGQRMEPADGAGG